MPRKAAAVAEAEQVVEEVLSQVPEESEPETPKRTFDPTRHLMKLKGKDYLEVKWRLVWARDRHPDIQIDTQLLSHSNNEAVVKATISIPNGGSATGLGSETKGDFGDYLEKAETKAIGRALGALGFGTQFSDDFEFGADQGKVVDSPVSRSSARSNGGSSKTTVAYDPSTFPAQNVPDGWACEECGDALPDTTRVDGTPHPAGAKAAYSVKNFGKILCGTHMKAEKEARLAAQG